MSENVLPFPTSGLTDFAEIPSPINARPGDTFLRLDVSSDLYAHMGFFGGAVLVVLLGALREGWPHLIERHGRLHMGRVMKVTTSHLHVFLWKPGAKVETYPAESLTVIGVAVEMYPTGIQGPRWVCHAEAVAEQCDGMEYPLAKVAN